MRVFFSTEAEALYFFDIDIVNALSLNSASILSLPSLFNIAVATCNMLPLVSLFAFSASVAAAATHDIQSRDTCSCLSPAAQTFANSAAVADAANKVTTPTGYTNTGGASSQWATGDGCLGFVNIDNYDSNVCAGICDTITECSTFQICKRLDTNLWRVTDHDRL